MVALASSDTDSGNNHPASSDAIATSYATDTVTGAPRPPLHTTSTRSRSRSRQTAAARTASSTASADGWTAASRAPAREAWVSRSESRAITPTCTSANSNRRRIGNSRANSTAAEPRSSLRSASTAGDLVDDGVEERRQLARRARPHDQHDGDRGRGQDHECVFRRRLPYLVGEPRTCPHVTRADVPGQQHPGSPPL